MNSGQITSFEDFMINYDSAAHLIDSQISESKFIKKEPNLIDDLDRLMQKDDKCDEFIKSLNKIHDEYK